MTETKINTNILKLKTSFHGGSAPKGFLDFSANLNPYPPSRKLVRAYKKTDFTKYPDSSAQKLVNKLSSTYNIPESKILCLNGTSQGIFLTALCLLGKDDKSLIIQPGFSEYERASIITGAEIVYYNLTEENGFMPDIDKLSEIISLNKPKLLWLCNPNNPTGTYISFKTVLKILDKLEKNNGIMVLDEAYVDFTRTPWDSAELLSLHNNIIILRSLTKNLNISGLRLGFMAGNAEIINAVSRIQPAWSINSSAINAGTAGLESLHYYKKKWVKMADNAESLHRSIKELGFSIINTTGNFIFFRNHLNINLAEKLFEKNIIVRDCTSFGLKNYIRIGSRKMAENKILVKALKDIIEKNNQTN